MVRIECTLWSTWRATKLIIHCSIFQEQIVSEGWQMETMLKLVKIIQVCLLNVVLSNWTIYIDQPAWFYRKIWVCLYRHEIQIVQELKFYDHRCSREVATWTIQHLIENTIFHLNVRFRKLQYLEGGESVGLEKTRLHSVTVWCKIHYFRTALCAISPKMIMWIIQQDHVIRHWVLPLGLWCRKLIIQNQVMI